jgi:predicted dehydrogenase
MPAGIQAVDAGILFVFPGGGGRFVRSSSKKMGEVMFKTTRRTFLQGAAAAAGTLGAVGLARAGKPSEQVQVGLIGVGIRGYALHNGVNQSEHARVGGIADVSEHYLDRIRPQLADPNTPIHRDYRRLLDDPSIDAVVISTPDHWHAQMTLDAMDAGKDVYVEKPMTYSLEEAKQVRDKAAESGRVTQVGYQRRTLDHYHKAREIVQSGILGKITHVQLWSSRNRETPPWRTYDNYQQFGLPERSGPEDVDWNRFQANRPPRPYDARRFFHWQCYEEYSTGIFGILASHPLDAANLVMDLDWPHSCSAHGGIYLYPDGRTVDDTCSALFHYPHRGLSMSFIGSSGNAFFDQEAHYRGTEGTLELGVSWLRVYAEGRNELFRHHVKEDEGPSDLRTDPVYDPGVDYRWSTVEHLDDFFINVKQRGTCQAPAEEGYRSMVQVAMALEAAKSERTVHWDAERERIQT